jgi:hypothetical protein
MESTDEFTSSKCQLMTSSTYDCIKKEEISNHLREMYCSR